MSEESAKMGVIVMKYSQLSLIVVWFQMKSMTVVQHKEAFGFSKIYLSGSLI